MLISCTDTIVVSKLWLRRGVCSCAEKAKKCEKIVYNVLEKSFCLAQQTNDFFQSLPLMVSAHSFTLLQHTFIGVAFGLFSSSGPRYFSSICCHTPALSCGTPALHTFITTIIITLRNVSSNATGVGCFIGLLFAS